MKVGKHTDQRDRTLCLARILYEETDEKHPMPMTEMIRRLGEEGVASERKSIYRDLAAMNKQGFEVAYRHGKTGGWYLAGRPLNLSELQTVIDAVAVYRWIPAALRASLLDKLAGLFPRGQRGQLRRPVSLPPQGVTAPEEVRQVLDRVHTALQSQRALRFVSFVYDPARRRVFSEYTLVVSPKGLLWSEEGYHLLGWNHRSKSLALYRTDRMSQVLVTGMPAQGPNPDPALWTAAPFGIEPNRRERVRLRCCRALADEILDRLGPAVQLTEGPFFIATADVILGPAFWAWLSMHTDTITLLSPAWAANLWTTRCRPHPGDAAFSTSVQRHAI